MEEKKYVYAVQRMDFNRDAEVVYKDLTNAMFSSLDKALNYLKMMAEIADGSFHEREEKEYSFTCVEGEEGVSSVYDICMHPLL